jgi:hypothetical protein
MRFVTRNVRNLSRAGSLKTVASEMAKCNLGLMAVPGVRWVQGGSQAADDYTSLYGNGNANHHSRSFFFVHKAIRLAAKRVEFISDRMSYITLKGR